MFWEQSVQPVQYWNTNSQFIFLILHFPTGGGKGRDLVRVQHNHLRASPKQHPWGLHHLCFNILKKCDWGSSDTIFFPQWFTDSVHQQVQTLQILSLWHYFVKVKHILVIEMLDKLCTEDAEMWWKYGALYKTMVSFIKFYLAHLWFMLLILDVHLHGNISDTRFQLIHTQI